MSFLSTTSSILCFNLRRVPQFQVKFNLNIFISNRKYCPENQEVQNYVTNNLDSLNNHLLFSKQLIRNSQLIKDLATKATSDAEKVLYEKVLFMTVKSNTKTEALMLFAKNAGLDNNLVNPQARQNFFNIFGYIYDLFYNIPFLRFCNVYDTSNIYTFFSNYINDFYTIPEVLDSKNKSIFDIKNYEYNLILYKKSKKLMNSQLNTFCNPESNIYLKNMQLTDSENVTNKLAQARHTYFQTYSTKLTPTNCQSFLDFTFSDVLKKLKKQLEVKSIVKEDSSNIVNDKQDQNIDNNTLESSNLILNSDTSSSTTEQNIPSIFEKISNLVFTNPLTSFNNFFYSGYEYIYNMSSSVIKYIISFF